MQSAAPEAPEQRTTPPVQSEAPEQRTPPVQSEAPEQRTPPVQSEAPRQSTEPRWDDPWEERARTDDVGADEDDDSDDDGAEGGEGSSSAKKPVYQRGMTRLPPRPDPAQRTLIAPDGEK